jgi:hypothetical protein
MNKSILVGAQFWAYGPAGKACAIAHELKKSNINVTFAGTQTSYQMCRDSGNFDKVVEIDDPHRYESLGNQFNGIVSVMDPYMALWAYKNNLPLVYADSMSWFWKWNRFDNKALDWMEKVKKMSFVDGCDLISKLEPDQRQLLAHLLSNEIYTQDTPQTIQLTENKVKNAGAMIDLNYIQDQTRDTVLISLSGEISPITNLGMALKYVDMIFDLLTDKLQKWPNASRFVLTGNPTVINSIKNHPEFVELKALNHPEFLSELNRAVAVLIPCGFTTIYESLAYGAPVGFLPENHNGHVYEYLTITKFVQKDREKIFPEALFTLKESSLENIRNLDESMSLINSCTNKYNSSKGYREIYKNKINDWLKYFSDPKSLHLEQQTQILKILPSFGGARIVADAILKLI